MTAPYKLVEKREGLWYIEGPGRGEEIDAYCETDLRLARLLVGEMNYAYYRGRDAQRKVVKGALNKLLELGLD